jgi:hypothetical protein
MQVTSFALLVSLALASPASAYFVIVLDDDAKLRADFVREEGGMVHASRGAGELQIDKARVRAIREVEPGAKVDVAEPLDAALASPPLEDAPDVAAAAPSVDPRERERQVAREIILGHRDLLFAKLRKESPEELAKREQQLAKLKGERKELQAKLPSWERSPTR